MTKTQTIRDLGKSPSKMAIPDLTRLQKKSFEFFTQNSSKENTRKDQGLEGMLRANFPVNLQDGSQLDYDDYTIMSPLLTPWECEKLSRTYSAELRIRLRNNTGKKVNSPAIDIPLITERGTFIIGGTEKVIIGELRTEEDTRFNDLTQRRLHLVGQQLQHVLAPALAEDIRGIAEYGKPDFPKLAQKLNAFFTNGSTARVANKTNPLALISHTRAVVQKGINRKPGYQARNVHPSHFGRLCLLETPEGEKIGMNLTTALFADVDSEGCLMTPYRKPDNGTIEMLSSETEATHVLGDLAPGDDYDKRYHGGVLARSGDAILRTDPSKVGYAPIHPAQALGVSAGLIPFLGNDDANRALMGTNMQKQAVPLITPEAPIIQTGIEKQVASDSRTAIIADGDGEVERVTDEVIVIRIPGGNTRTYPCNQIKHPELGVYSGCRPLVSPGDRISTGQVIADGPATDGGILALGRNVLVGYMPWKGYNFEDGIVVSDRLIRDHVFTSANIREFKAVITPSGNETLGFDHLDSALCRNLAQNGLVREGTSVRGNDILIARSENSGKDTSIRMPYGQEGIVVKVEHYTSGNGCKLDTGVLELARITLAARRDLKVGDKLCNRHGAKGVVALIVPENEMPVLPDGRSLEVIMNPLGIPSRMNIGSILETHLGLAAHALDCTIVTPGFNGATVADIEELLAEANLPESGMFRLRNGKTGREYDQETTVGYQYLMKLDHMVDDAIQIRGTGPYSNDTQQPVSGRRCQGGLRIGIMETWALQAYGAAYILQELLTIKSDDAVPREKLYDSLVRNQNPPKPTVPHSLRRLAAQLLGLCLDIRVFDKAGTEMDLAKSGTSVDDIVSASLGFADGNKISSLSVNVLNPSEDHNTFEAVFGEDDGLSIKHLELASPVHHLWQDRLKDGNRIPPITHLPVLPPALRGKGLNETYMAVFKANIACLKSGSDRSSLTDLQVAVNDLMDGLSRMLHGKNGWITAAISGKRVDYCGRSVVCPGPDLDYDTCSIPIPMAATLLEPVVVGRMIREGLVNIEKEAVELLRKQDPKALEILVSEAEKQYLLLHRAPVLHRMGIQAFRMKLTGETVIRIHPLTMVAFNADFDGDEMDIFLPLSDNAQGEARNLIRSSLSQVSPASGRYLNGPTQDMVFGCYYATCRGIDGVNPVQSFETLDSIALSMNKDEIKIHDVIRIGERTTTVGRALFNRLLPEAVRWVDTPTTKHVLADLLYKCWNKLGKEAAAALGSAMMRFGFEMATLSGASIGKDILKQYSGYKADLAKGWSGVEKLKEHWDIVNHWASTTEQMTQTALEELASDQEGLNPVYMMAVSGARGTLAQIRQLNVIRGLMAMPDGRVISDPLTGNFLHGLSPYEYLMSAFGARKGLSDTALKSADAGFLFKRIMGAVQDVMVVEDDCGTTEGVFKEIHPGGEHDWFPLRERISGRTALADIFLPDQEKPVVNAGETISSSLADAIEKAELREIGVRSPVTCRSQGGICVKCYGLNLSTGKPPEIGLAAGVISAQSIGEPATQLTMRTFHLPKPTGKGTQAESDFLAGLPRFDQLMEAWTRNISDKEEYDNLCEIYDRAGVGVVSESLLVEMQKVYRVQGIRVDDRHFEVVLSRMLTNGRVKGISQAATETTDFIVAGSSRNGIDALAKLAAKNQPVTINAIRNCTAFGKKIPSVM